MTEPPIVCTLTTPELRERRDGLLRRVGARMLASRPLADAGGGWELRFPGDEAAVADVLELVRLESRCCAFLRFRVTLEPAGGEVALEVSGPPGGAEILVRELIPELPAPVAAPGRRPG
ncbi:MAG TPA: hypothetical protein VKY89_12790 [Thermoanaerobaculia bacterium]|jgi:hypothetical protein|nr:hypothetical protein [Thermoanaerobaculia bacterium]